MNTLPYTVCIYELALCRFIGELFKLRMLLPKIMHDCIVSLLKASSDEESLESLCRLLATIGRELDIEKAKVGWLVTKTKLVRLRCTHL